MKKTIIGIMIMAVAIMMTLSSAVFAANAITITTSGDVKVGETVTVTFSYPTGTAAAQYVISYDADKLTYTGNNEFAVLQEAGKIEVGHVDMALNEIKSDVLTFTAKTEGDAKVAVSSITAVMDTNGDDITGVTAGTATVKVVKEESPVTPEEPSNPGTAGDPATPGTSEPDKKPETPDASKKDDGDKPIDKLKDAKTGFDAMYIVYLAAAVLVAGGIVTVAKRK